MGNHGGCQSHSFQCRGRKPSQLVVPELLRKVIALHSQWFLLAAYWPLADCARSLSFTTPVRFAGWLLAGCWRWCAGLGRWGAGFGNCAGLRKLCGNCCVAFDVVDVLLIGGLLVTPPAPVIFNSSRRLQPSYVTEATLPKPTSYLSKGLW